jgi:hypothetical protein
VPLSRFEELHLEFRLLVLDYLPTGSAIYLSLTSKYQCLTLIPRVDPKFCGPTSHAEAWKRFIRLILPDITPTWINCHHCNKLSLWRPSRHNSDYYTVSLCSRAHEEYREQLRPFDYSIDWRRSLTKNAIEAYVRAHKLGPNYGPALKSLSTNARIRVIIPATAM